MKRFALLIFALLFTKVSFSQVYSGDRCICCNPYIKTFLHNDTASLVLDYSQTGAWADWATSFLTAFGNPPQQQDPERNEPDFEDEWYAYDSWTCMFSAQSLHDDSPKTCWSEAVDGFGKGEAVIAYLGAEALAPQIWAGFGASESLYLANNRPRNVKVYLLMGQPNPTQMGLVISDIRVMSVMDVQLEDKNGYQDLPIAYVTTDANEKHKVFLIAVEIIDVYKGTKYDDTCISEIKVM